MLVERLIAIPARLRRFRQATHMCNDLGVGWRMGLSERFVLWSEIQTVVVVRRDMVTYDDEFLFFQRRDDSWLSIAQIDGDFHPIISAVQERLGPTNPLWQEELATAKLEEAIAIYPVELS